MFLLIKLSTFKLLVCLERDLRDKLKIHLPDNIYLWYTIKGLEILGSSIRVGLVVFFTD